MDIFLPLSYYLMYSQTKVSRVDFNFSLCVCSYGLLFGLGCAMVRETSMMMMSQYFKRRREVVETIASAGTGLGIAIFSNIFKSGIG